MPQTDKLAIMKAVNYSWRFVSTAWLPTLPAYLVKALIIGICFAVLLSGDEQLASFAPFLMLLWFAAAMACMAMAFRLALRGEFKGVLGLQLTQDEPRLALANVIYYALMTLISIVLLFIVFNTAWMFIATTIPDMAAVQDDPDALQKAIVDGFKTPLGALTAIFSLVAFFGPLLWLQARLITFPAATIARGKIMIFETLSWTKGLTIQVLIALVIAFLPFWLVTQIAQYFVLEVLGLPTFFQPIGDDLVITRMQGFIVGAVYGLVSIPMSLVWAGLSSFMYRGFDPELVD